MKMDFLRRNCCRRDTWGSIIPLLLSDSVVCPNSNTGCDTVSDGQP